MYKQLTLPFEKVQPNPISSEHDLVFKMPGVEGMRFPGTQQPDTVVILHRNDISDETRAEIEALVSRWGYKTAYELR